jgi:hypothetical protein
MINTALLVAVGQAIVQMARSRLSGHEYAIKFFLCPEAFKAESALYQDGCSNPLCQFLPLVRDVVSNADNSVVDRLGNPLPPCIVMERGEPLDNWLSRAKPDRTQVFSVRHPYKRLCLLCILRSALQHAWGPCT